jgi:hypothetical protein
MRASELRKGDVVLVRIEGRERSGSVVSLPPSRARQVRGALGGVVVEFKGGVRVRVSARRIVRRTSRTLGAEAGSRGADAAVPADR